MKKIKITYQFGLFEVSTKDLRFTIEFDEIEFDRGVVELVEEFIKSQGERVQGEPWPNNEDLAAYGAHQKLNDTLDEEKS